MMLDPRERQRLATLAGALIPGGAGQPGALALDLAGAPVDGVLQIDPAYGPALRAFLALDGPGDRLDQVEALAQRDPDGFRALSIVIANAYFMHPDARAAIGYPGQQARDSSVGLTADDLALAAVVTARGLVFRKT
jgi:hypothetical protein